ncbi:helix-turn-helix transcriptional regulator [Microlunatus speluncae]|uniref:helix-turn-helix transcriptional regulator n=1 Tax=Microlunatus speluncae TaxID=2594267 RepID=UPI00137601C0|nr:LuxR C-terminal-related transcriptional regulator [Microlunatus speluncae]
MTVGLPGELSSFVGRATELEAVGRALAAARLLTLAGPGGCGKTRLAIRAARQAGLADTIWVDLSEETSSDDVVPRVAEAVATPRSKSDPAAVVAALSDRPALIVIDNCEQVRGAVADFAESALRHCPDLTILATSREPLGLPGERVWRLPPMILEESIELFLDRAGTASVSPEARVAARRICDHLDRLPLALELAASWSETLALQEIAELLINESGHPLLGGAGRSAPFRQRTLADSIEWSHRLLTADEQLLLRRLAPFQQFGLDAVRMLADGQAEDQLRALKGLIDKSLVVCDTSGPRSRHHLLRVVGEFALARLREAGEEEALRHRHARIQLDLLTGLEPLLSTDKDAWRERVREFRSDLASAAEWCLAGGDPDLGRRLCAAAGWWWHLTGDRAGYGLLRRAAAMEPDRDLALQARVLVALSLVADMVQPDAESAAAEQGLELSLAAGDLATARLARLQVAIGRLGSDLDDARELALRCHDEAVAHDDSLARDGGGTLVGLVAALHDAHAEAIDWLGRSTPGLLARGDRGIAGTGLCALALSHAAVGDLARAEDTARHGLRVTEPLQDFGRVGVATWGLARILAFRGDLVEAEARLAGLQRLIDRAGEEPYIPGWYATRARVALWSGDAEAAVRWCDRDRFGHTPDLHLAEAAARRALGQVTAAATLLDRAAASPILESMPAIRADHLAERARLRAASDPIGATATHREALRLRWEHGLVLDTIDSLESLAALAGSPERAAILYGAADRARRDTGFRAGPPDLPAGPEFAVGLDRGRALGLDQAVDRALRARGRADRPADGWASLTPAERSVVELAVRGLSNPEIAAALFIGRGTVKTHLAHVYAKLGIANRTELARSAATAGLAS